MAHTIGTLRKETYYASSKKLGDIGRQLALVGIAVAWLFHQKAEGGVIQVPRQILWALIFLTAALAADFLRYALQTLIWGIWCALLENEENEEDEEKEKGKEKEKKKEKRRRIERRIKRRKKEKKRKERKGEDGHYQNPKWINEVAVGLLFLNAACVALGYSWLACYLFGQLECAN